MKLSYNILYLTADVKSGENPMSIYHMVENDLYTEFEAYEGNGTVNPVYSMVELATTDERAVTANDPSVAITEQTHTNSN